MTGADPGFLGRESGVSQQEGRVLLLGQRRRSALRSGHDPDELRNIAQDAAAKSLLDEMRMRIMRKAIAAADPLPERIAPY